MTRARRHLRILDAWRAPIWFTQSGLGPKGREPLSSPPAATSQHGFHAVHNASAAADDTLDKRQDTDFQEREQGSSACRQPGAVGRGRLRAGVWLRLGRAPLLRAGFREHPGAGLASGLSMNASLALRTKKTPIPRPEKHLESPSPTVGGRGAEESCGCTPHRSACVGKPPRSSSGCGQQGAGLHS